MVPPRGGKFLGRGAAYLRAASKNKNFRLPPSENPPRLNFPAQLYARERGGDIQVGRVSLGGFSGGSEEGIFGGGVENFSYLKGINFRRIKFSR